MTSMREAGSEADWWAVRELIVRTQPLVPAGWNWDIRHWDGNRFHAERTEPPAPVGLWFAADTLVAAAHGESGDDVFLELDPSWRQLEPEMLTWAGRRLCASDADGRRHLRAIALDNDEQRRKALRTAGYDELAEGWWSRTIDLDGGQLAAEDLVPPYRLATTSADRAWVDAAAMANLLNASFGRTVHTAAEYVGFMRNSPSFRHDLNLVAVAPDGSFAAHVGVTYDEANRFGIFEPVCTHPAHRRHGLARGLISNGLRRLSELGAASAYVETGEAVAANALYRAVGFGHEQHAHWYQRSWPASG
jgi:mycothiol synthase